MKCILHCVAVGLSVLTVSCPTIPQQEPVEIVETPVEKVAERSPMQADLDDFASAYAFFDENKVDAEEYKAAILEFVACIQQDEEYVEHLADLKPGQKAAVQWSGLIFFMAFSQVDLTEDSVGDSAESSELETYGMLLAAVEFCEEQEQQERIPSRREFNL